jgi:hypothetical protein
MVRTAASQAVNRGSIPLRATNTKDFQTRKSFVLVFVLGGESKGIAMSEPISLMANPGFGGGERF